MCWSGSEVLVSMLAVFSAAGEWWIDMVEEDVRFVENYRRKERIEERCLITLAF